MPFYILPFKPFSASFCPLVLGTVINPLHKALLTFEFSLDIAKKGYPWVAFSIL
jgi:hypothetical protein